ncbi:hypothetical protein TorRG33x02_182470 [Trema orientale]|uniref:Uncharacterized protein n=1 Tax=Trema orientale TaxID=63057 RepID=A0A2P5EK95_TREOI|nr:hypothetical protein TorRG33x02_182470 [Trema orientale]
MVVTRHIHSSHTKKVAASQATRFRNHPSQIQVEILAGAVRAQQVPSESGRVAERWHCLGKEPVERVEQYVDLSDLYA